MGIEQSKEKIGKQILVSIAFEGYRTALNILKRTDPWLRNFQGSSLSSCQWYMDGCLLGITFCCTQRGIFHGYRKGVLACLCAHAL